MTKKEIVFKGFTYHGLSSSSKLGVSLTILSHRCGVGFRAVYCWSPCLMNTNSIARETSQSTPMLHKNHLENKRLIFTQYELLSKRQEFTNQ